MAAERVSSSAAEAVRENLWFNLSEEPLDPRLIVVRALQKKGLRVTISAPFDELHPDSEKISETLRNFVGVYFLNKKEKDCFDDTLNLPEVTAITRAFGLPLINPSTIFDDCLFDKVTEERLMLTFWQRRGNLYRKQAQNANQSVLSIEQREQEAYKSEQEARKLIDKGVVPFSIEDARVEIEKTIATRF